MMQGMMVLAGMTLNSQKTRSDQMPVNQRDKVK